MVSGEEEPRVGAHLVADLSLGPARQRWISEVCEYIPGERLVEVQIKGPFAHWQHVHAFLPESDNVSTLSDEVEYALPLGAAGEVLGSSWVRHELLRIFRYRHRRTADDLALHAAYADRPRLTVAITGSSGLLGGELAAFLSSGGHRVLRIVRHSPRAADEIFWDPRRALLEPELLEGVDAVVHLAARSLNALRWTSGVKREILASRIEGTSLIARTVARTESKPVLITNSAIGYYGDRGDELLDERSPLGSGFLAEVCDGWERSLAPARDAGVRVVILRTGVVLSGHGGALPRMLPAYRTGLGGPLGSGRQWMSWIALQDYIGIAYRALFDRGLNGPVATVAPHPVTNRDFIAALTRVLHRPGVIPLPEAALRATLGEMGARMLLDSTRVVPTRLAEAGHVFRYPDVEEALRAELALLRPQS